MSMSDIRWSFYRRLKLANGPTWLNHYASVRVAYVILSYIHNIDTFSEIGTVNLKRHIVVLVCVCVRRYTCLRGSCLQKLRNSRDRPCFLFFFFFNCKNIITLPPPQFTPKYKVVYDRPYTKDFNVL